MAARVIAGFTIDGGTLKSFLSAYGAVSSDFYWVFTRDAMQGTALDPPRVSAIGFRLSPPDYGCETDRFWVRGSVETLLKLLRHVKRTDEVRVEVRDDNKLYFGPFQHGEVEKEDEVYESFKVPTPKIAVKARLRVALDLFRRIVKRAADEKRRDYIVSTAYDNIGFDVRDREGTILFFDDKVSRVDFTWGDPWMLHSEGHTKATYTLARFSELLVLGISNALDLSLGEGGIAELSYSGDHLEVKLWLAPVDAKGRFEELLAKPVAERKMVWRLRNESVRLLEKTLRAVSSIVRAEEVNLGSTGEDLWIYWKKYQNGYFQVGRYKFEEFVGLEERLSGVFGISDLAAWLKDVEDLSCFLEPEAVVLVGKGEKIAPKEIRSSELLKEIEVPEVKGMPVFSGPASIIGDVFDDADAAEDTFLVFISRPFEVEAVGRDKVYYRATLPLDSFKHIEENYVPVNSSYFRMLRGFFTSFPPALVTLGRLGSNIFISAENPLGELRALVMQSGEEAREAIEAYKEEMKPPPAAPPPEVKPLPPPPIEYVTLHILADVPTFVGADHKEYGPFKVGQEAWMPKLNAEGLVREGRASWMPPAKPRIEEIAEEALKELEAL